MSIKVIQPSFLNSNLGSTLIKNEISILKQVKHKNVLALVEVVENKDNTCIVTEFCDGGDLEILINKKRIITEKVALSYITKIVDGCLYLREKKIIHRDIKPSNIFFKGSEPVIADFGFSVLESNTQLLKCNAGSPLYMPHESLVSK